MKDYISLGFMITITVCSIFFKVLEDDRIDINTATAIQLEHELPGVGEKKSEKIILNRPYENIYELLDKKVVGEVVFDKIKNKIKIGRD